MIIGILILAIISGTTSHVHAFEAPAFMPSTERLEETKTEHFHIIFQESLQDAVPYLAAQCEQAYQDLTPVFGWYPERKIEVLFIDAFDTHNGWATTMPHNRIAVYAAGAESGSTIFQPGNYLRRTVYHELAHVLSMDIRYGYNRVLSGIFGKFFTIANDPLSLLMFFFSASPVVLAPVWYLEGIAIWAETEFAPPGRGRMSIPDMIFRSAVQENNLLPYNKWDLEIPRWPYGLGAYLYGMKLIRHISDTSSIDNPVGDLSQSLAHAFMFRFDRHSVQVVGGGIKMFVQDMLAAERQKQQENLKELKKLQPTKLPRLTSKEIIVHEPRFVGEEIYFSAQEEEERDSLYVYVPEGKETRKIAGARTTAGFGSLSVSPDGSIYYTRLEAREKDNYWYEVRRFSPEEQTDTLVTNSGRYRAVDVSPSGLNLAAVSMRAGKSCLVEVPISGAGDQHQEKILASGALQENFSSVRYSPDGEKIAYVRGGEDGFSLLVFDRRKAASYPVFHTRRQLLFPTWAPDRKSIVFSSDENGVFNLYRISSDGKGSPVPLTHALGGVFASDFSPDGKTIAACAYDSHGYYLTLIPYEPQMWLEKKLPCIRTEWKQRKQEKKRAGTKPAQLKEKIQLEPYSSLKNVQFDYWGPWLTASAKGIVGGFGAAFSDPTGYQDFQLLAGAESEYGTGIGAIQYTYKGFYPVFKIYALQNQANYPDLLRSASGTRYGYTEEIRTLGAAVDIPLIKMDRQISMQLGYKSLHRDFIKDSRDDYQGETILNKHLYEGNEGTAWVGLNYFDGTAFKRSNSVEDGRFAGVTMEKTDPGLGGSVSQTRAMGEWIEYISNPWLKNHVLRVSANFGLGGGDRTDQGLFGLGGFGSLLAAGSPGIQRGIYLRGYDENFQTGDRIAKVSCSYRFPILDLSRGVAGSMPVYFKQIFAEVFYEGGRTWDDKGIGDDKGWINAAGLEANFSLKLLRFMRIAPGLGFAFAADRPRNDSENDEGLDERFQVYVAIKAFVNF